MIPKIDLVSLHQGYERYFPVILAFALTLLNLSFLLLAKVIEVSLVPFIFLYSGFSYDIWALVTMLEVKEVQERLRPNQVNERKLIATMVGAKLRGRGLITILIIHLGAVNFFLHCKGYVSNSSIFAIICTASLVIAYLIPILHLKFIYRK